MKRYAVIMAGGTGSRLWPISRQKKPKQFIDFVNGKPMLTQTIEYLTGIVCMDDCFIVTNCILQELVHDTIKDIVPATNVIVEPLKKNTAACIAYSALLLRKERRDGILCCIPSDSNIADAAAYRDALETACIEAEGSHSMVVIGIAPSFPSTGYGYIKSDRIMSTGDMKIARVQKFAEKPCIEKAKEFVSCGEYLWNSGILVGRLESILDNVERFLPGLYKELSDAVNNTDGASTAASLEKAYSAIEDISFDKGVLEKCNNLCVVKGNFQWSDVGSLDMLDKILKRDANGNVILGDHIGIDTNNSVVYSRNSLIATIGLDNIAIINTGDVTLVCPRNRAHEIKNIVEMAKLNGYEKYI